MEALGRQCACEGAPAVDIHPMAGKLDSEEVRARWRVCCLVQGLRYPKH